MTPKNSTDLERAFEEIGALWRYRSKGPHARTVLHDRHMDCYFNSNFVCRSPHLVAEICSEYLVPEVSQWDEQPDWVVTYPPYGLPLAFELAKQLNRRFAYMDHANPENCVFGMLPGERALVVADDIYGGGSTRKTAALLEERGIIVCDTFVFIANLSNAEKLDGRSIYSLIAPQVQRWSGDEEPPIDPASPGVPAREKWIELVGEARIQRKPSVGCLCP